MSMPGDIDALHQPQFYLSPQNFPTPHHLLMFPAIVADDDVTTVFIAGNGNVVGLSIATGFNRYETRSVELTWPRSRLKYEI